MKNVGVTWEDRVVNSRLIRYQSQSIIKRYFLKKFEKSQKDQDSLGRCPQPSQWSIFSGGN